MSYEILKRQDVYEIPFVSVPTLEALESSNSRYFHYQIS